MKHPDKCPECGSEIVYYERFVGEHGAFCCDDCEWQHELTNHEAAEYLKEARNAE